MAVSGAQHHGARSGGRASAPAASVSLQTVKGLVPVGLGGEGQLTGVNLLPFIILVKPLSSCVPEEVLIQLF